MGLPIESSTHLPNCAEIVELDNKLAATSATQRKRIKVLIYLPTPPYHGSQFSLPQRSQKRLSQKRIAPPLHRLRPLLDVDFRAQRRGPRFAAPTDLFHVVVQLEGKAVRVDGERGVVDAGE